MYTLLVQKIIDLDITRDLRPGEHVREHVAGGFGRTLTPVNRRPLHVQWEKLIATYRAVFYSTLDPPVATNATIPNEPVFSKNSPRPVLLTRGQQLPS